MSSPVRLRSEGHHGHATKNATSKQQQMRVLREKARLLRLELNREKITEKEDYQQQLEQLRKQADALCDDPEILFREDEAVAEVKKADFYEEELEAFLDEADLELEQQLRDLQL